MRIVTRCVADDGTEFTYEAACIEHDKLLVVIGECNLMIDDGKSLIDVYKYIQVNMGVDYALTLPKLRDEELIIMSKITKDTKLKISHWQCSDVPQYQLSTITPYRKMYFGNDVDGYGRYGNWIGLPDVIRYYKETFSENKFEER